MRKSGCCTFGLVGICLAQQKNFSVDRNAPPGNLSTLPNGTLFEAWRPRAHILPPFGQIGDPCGHYVDTKDGFLHFGFLHDGNGAAGVTTDDLVHYKDVNPQGRQFIFPGGVNDPVAVFDGTVINQGVNGEPTFLYTSISYLPIQWTIAYTRGSETMSLAVSVDGGRNFTKLDQGPVISDPPFAVNVTGFRDPFALQNAQLDELLGSPARTWYLVIAGGVHDSGPSQFLYRQNDTEFQFWEELGQWWHEPANSTWGEGLWAGRWGFNFEASTIFGLDESGFNENGTIFTTVGAEWSLDPIVPQVSDFRDSLWAAGTVELSDGDIRFNPSFAGVLDWGASAYASHGQHLPAWSKASQKSGAPDRYITTIWLTGDFYDTTDPASNQQNWTGTLLLPRELSVGRVENVVNNELVKEIGSWKSQGYSDLVEVMTLKQVVVREVMAAISNCSSSTEPSRSFNVSTREAFQQSPKTKLFVLKASLSFPSSARGTGLKAGFQILASDVEATSIYYQFSNESIIIDRTNTSAASALNPGIISQTEAGRLRLFDRKSGDQQKIEVLDLMIVVDNSVVEVHANDRFVVSTWARSWYSNSTELRFFYDGQETVEFENITIFDGLYDAYPDRA
ncbi:hypothetical protein PFICI_01283 [Pestalotiopsis fici W106-1]|uniref:Glycosyl hydrolase family 32 C-terminal domain-containing protein n=1 Tax=Pestalotiopsis fici (strain W106-1 / CGMCC3.15140) TaxID=1229662 RepID=W3XND0_PESFW|nr:uncharacterized protein PFICI_01283 [Pestalotiopsis fici W106-1]ETS87455.1 hypothetical protein PFICI_01283 [Pestalotiopsis fici W106-1]